MFPQESCEIQQQETQKKLIDHIGIAEINTKNQLDKKWITTDVNNLDFYLRHKEKYTSYYNTFETLFKYAIAALDCILQCILILNCLLDFSSARATMEIYWY